MKRIYYLLFLYISFMFLPSATLAVVSYQSQEKEVLIAKKELTEVYKDFPTKKRKKIQKRLKKLKKKLSKLAEFDTGVFDEPRFRLGALIFLAGVALLLLSVLFIGVGGLLVRTSQLAVIIGIVLMVWAIIEY